MKTTFAAGRSSSANNHDQGELLAVLDLFNDKNSRSINQLVPLEHVARTRGDAGSPGRNPIVDGERNLPLFTSRDAG
jgi:hypothetical protein